MSSRDRTKYSSSVLLSWPLTGVSACILATLLTILNTAAIELLKQGMSDSIISLRKISQWLLMLLIHCLKDLYSLDFCDVLFPDSSLFSFGMSQICFLTQHAPNPLSYGLFMLVVFSDQNVLPPHNGTTPISFKSLSNLFLNEAYPEHSINLQPAFLLCSPHSYLPCPVTLVYCRMSASRRQRSFWFYALIYLSKASRKVSDT